MPLSAKLSRSVYNLYPSSPIRLCINPTAVLTYHCCTIFVCDMLWTISAALYFIHLWRVVFQHHAYQIRNMSTVVHCINVFSWSLWVYAFCTFSCRWSIFALFTEIHTTNLYQCTNYMGRDVLFSHITHNRSEICQVLFIFIKWYGAGQARESSWQQFLFSVFQVVSQTLAWGE